MTADIAMKTAKYFGSQKCAAIKPPKTKPKIFPKLAIKFKLPLATSISSFLAIKFVSAMKTKLEMKTGMVKIKAKTKEKAK
ncbi:hypothetical protein D3C87_1521390 [compost metagenome]